MKIYVNATFLSSEFLTGLARFAITLSLALKEKLGDDVIFLAPPAIQHSEVADELGAIRVGFNTNRVLWEQIDLPIYLSQRNNPLLLSFSNTAPLLYFNQVVSVLDLFYHKVDELPMNNKGAYSWATTQYFKLTIPYLVKRAKQVLTISEYSKEDIVNLLSCPPERISVIYPSVSSIFLEKKEDVLPNKFGKYILGVSAVTPRKNFDGLIKSYKKANFNDTKLVIVGGFEKTMKNYPILGLHKDDENIIFTGFVTDKELISLYTHALFFAYPSFLEGFGIPPLEAMACGCPTLVSNVTSLPEVCGTASYYVDPYNIDSIAEGMIELHKDSSLRQKLVDEGFLRLPIFEKSQSVSKLIEMLYSVSTSHNREYKMT